MTSEDDRGPETELTFETALEKLEEIVGKLEEGDRALDEAIRLYEEGVRLHKLCQEKLAAARGKLEKVVEDQAGEVSLEPFEDATSREGSSPSAQHDVRSADPSQERSSLER